MGTTMTLPAEGIEEVHIPATNVPNGATVTGSIDRITWVTTSTDPNGAYQFLIQGPKANGAPAGTPVVPSTGCSVYLRIVNSPEVIIRLAGTISVI